MSDNLSVLFKDMSDEDCDECDIYLRDMLEKFSVIVTDMLKETRESDKIHIGFYALSRFISEVEAQHLHAMSPSLMTEYVDFKARILASHGIVARSDRSTCDQETVL